MLGEVVWETTRPNTLEDELPLVPHLALPAERLSMEQLRRVC